MQRQLSQIIPLNNLIFVIGTFFFKRHNNPPLAKYPTFFNAAESGSGKSTFINLIIKNLNSG